MAVKLDKIDSDDLDMDELKALLSGKTIEDFTEGSEGDEEETPEGEEAEDTSEDEVEEADDDTEETDEAEEAPAKPKHIHTKEERAIIEAKQANKILKAQLAEMQRKLDETAVSERAKAKMQSFLDKGYDEDDAREASEREARYESMERRMAVLDFKSDHPKLVERYPELDVPKVKALMESTGADADVVCRLLYSGKTTLSEKAKAATVAEVKRSKSAAAGAAVSAGSTSGSAIKLTSEQEKLSRHLARILGRAPTAKEIKEAYE